MSCHTNLCRTVRAGDPIKPWIALGPFYEEVSDVVHSSSCCESGASTLGADILEQAASEAAHLLANETSEGSPGVFRSQEATWELVRRPDTMLSWGKFFKPHHLASILCATRVTPLAPGPTTLRLTSQSSQRVLLLVNGEAVVDRFVAPGDEPEIDVTVDLVDGENRLAVAVARIGRMARVGFHLQSLDADLSVQVPLIEGMSMAERSAVESDVCSLGLEKDMFYPEDEIALRHAIGADDSEAMQVRLLAEDGSVAATAGPDAGGKLVLCRGADLADGDYALECAWRAADGRLITATRFALRKISPIPAPQGHDQLHERRRLALAHYADIPQKGPIWRGHIWRELARYASGRYDEIDARVVRETCEFIKSPVTGSDFEIQAVLRMMHWERSVQRLSDELNAVMKDAILNYKYWADEPGPSKYFGSENHRFMYHVAEMLAGQLFPLDEFANSRQRGLFHALKGRTMATEWMRQRGRFGFDEWHSNTYLPTDMPPLLNLYDFAINDDYKLKQMAGSLLDYLCFTFAADTFQGVFGTTHGRSYGESIRYPEIEGTSPVCWLLYGTGSLHAESRANATLSLATSQYAPPAFFHDIANDREAVVEARERQGVLRTSCHHADFVVYRTPDYQMSGLQDHRKGEHEAATLPACVTLGNKVILFVTAPNTSDEGSGQRPDYWSGNTSVPRVVQQRNVMSLIFRLSHWAWMSHCFFEAARFDEVRYQGNWAFGRVGDGYVGIYSQHGMTLAGYGQYAGRELVCDAPENTWIIECGRQVEYDSFDTFVKVLTQAPIEERDGSIAYVSPSIGRFVTGWDVAPTVNGEPIQLAGYPMVDSPWAHAEFGSGEMVITYQGNRRELWFNQ